MAGYALMIDIDPSGKLNWLLPNRLTTGPSPYAPVSAGETISSPPPGAGFRFRITGQTGRGTVVAIVAETKQQLDALRASVRSIDVEAVSTAPEKGNVIVDRWLQALEKASGAWAVGRVEYTVTP
jgi:hypothetical protein